MTPLGPQVSPGSSPLGKAAWLVRPAVSFVPWPPRSPSERKAMFRVASGKGSARSGSLPKVRQLAQGHKAWGCAPEARAQACPHLAIT